MTDSMARSRTRSDLVLAIGRSPHQSSLLASQAVTIPLLHPGGDYIKKSFIDDIEM
jgi:hypothetical protein